MGNNVTFSQCFLEKYVMFYFKNLIHVNRWLFYVAILNELIKIFNFFFNVNALCDKYQ